jgi:hypothetical protein
VADGLLSTADRSSLVAKYLPMTSDCGSSPSRQRTFRYFDLTLSVRDSLCSGHRTKLASFTRNLSLTCTCHRSAFDAHLDRMR